MYGQMLRSSCNTGKGREKSTRVLNGDEGSRGTLAVVEAAGHQVVSGTGIAGQVTAAVLETHKSSAVSGTSDLGGKRLARGGRTGPATSLPTRFAEALARAQGQPHGVVAVPVAIAEAPPSCWAAAEAGVADQTEGGGISAQAEAWQTPAQVAALRLVADAQTGQDLPPCRDTGISGPAALRRAAESTAHHEEVRPGVDLRSADSLAADVGWEDRPGVGGAKAEPLEGAK